jgi:hypothetical protein
MEAFIEGVLSNFLGSWRTTVMGWGSGLMLIVPELIKLLDGDLQTEFNIANVWVGLGIMGIGTFARDNNKTSEEVRAK